MSVVADEAVPVRTEWPPFVTIGGNQLHQNFGKVLAEVASGAIVRIIDKRTGACRGYIVPPGELPAELRGAEDLLPTYPVTGAPAASSTSGRGPD